MYIIFGFAIIGLVLMLVYTKKRFFLIATVVVGYLLFIDIFISFTERPMVTRDYLTGVNYVVIAGAVGLLWWKFSRRIAAWYNGDKKRAQLPVDIKNEEVKK